MPFNPEPYNILLAVKTWLILVVGCGALLVLVASLIALAVRGTAGVKSVLRLVGDGFREVLHLSLRRIFALATLTFKESVRRKIMYIFVVFIILIMFAGWFMQEKDVARADMEIKNHVSFALKTTLWLSLPVVLLLACWGLPEDIKARTLHTVVTKPVRRSEVVLGRMLGFVWVGTLVVAVMGSVGYVWVTRQVSENAKDQLFSKVPVYGQLSFRDRDGNPVDKGINVGDIWGFRSFIEGGTKSQAIWNFEGINVEQLRRQKLLKLESSIEAFRTHTGDIVTGVLCEYELVNPDNEEIRAGISAFPITEFGETVTEIPPEISIYDAETQQTSKVSLFDDLISDGKLRVIVRCVDQGQYLGMARSDLFVRMPKRHFFFGFSKSVLSIWLMVVLVIILGVTASCFLKGPIATMATFSLIIIGQGFRSFMDTMVTGQFTGGGPFESVARIWTHQNVQSKMEENVVTSAIAMIDDLVIGILWAAGHLIPNFEHFTRASQYAPNGFDVDWQAGMLPVICMTVAYLVPCVLVGFYSLKLRELESK